MSKLGTINLSTLSSLRRFHMVIFIVTVVVGLTVATLLLNAIVIKTSDPAIPAQDTMETSFDQRTIDRIKQLKTTSDPSTPLDFSSGRISPFSE